MAKNINIEGERSAKCYKAKEDLQDLYIVRQRILKEKDYAPRLPTVSCRREPDPDWRSVFKVRYVEENWEIGNR